MEIFLYYFLYFIFFFSRLVIPIRKCYFFFTELSLGIDKNLIPDKNLFKIIDLTVQTVKGEMQIEIFLKFANEVITKTSQKKKKKMRNRK